MSLFGRKHGSGDGGAHRPPAPPPASAPPPSSSSSPPPGPGTEPFAQPPPRAAEPPTPEPPAPEPPAPEPPAPEPPAPEPPAPEPPAPVATPPATDEPGQTQATGPFAGQPVRPSGRFSGGPTASATPGATGPSAGEPGDPGRSLGSGVSYLRPVGNEAVARELEPAPQANPGLTPPSRRGSSGRFLTDVIVDLNYAGREVVDEAVAAARVQGRAPEQVLIDNAAISQDQLARAIAERHGLDHLDLNAFTVDMAAANLVNPAAAKRYEAVPVKTIDDHTLLVAMADPANVLAVDDIAMITQQDVRIAVASSEDILALVGRLSHFEDAVQEAVEEEEDAAEVVELRESADDAPVVKLVNSIIGQAAERGASDIHFEPEQGEMRVRFRVDGVLQGTSSIPRRMVSGVVSRVKIMANLDIAEKRLPQDGRVGLTIEGRHVDLRVVTLPSVHGESIVIRILDKEAVKLDLNLLGMQPTELERFRRAFSQAYGAVLVTGPTGSGKSTSLYGALGELNTPEKNVITIEDPVEYEIEGITQVQVNTRTGLTFAQGLRAMMRADPDVVMVGEIRDRETAQIAIEAALTGHLVLSTLHTNDAPTSMARLMEMGVEPFLVASAIDCVVAQRLARQLCSTCKRRTIIPASVLRESGYPAQVDLEAYEPTGCGRCNNLGYKGRIGLYEVMTVTDEMRTLVLERAPADQIGAAAARAGMRGIREDGIEKVKQGITSMAEVARVAGTG